MSHPVSTKQDLRNDIHLERPVSVSADGNPYQGVESEGLVE